MEILWKAVGSHGRLLVLEGPRTAAWRVCQRRQGCRRSRLFMDLGVRERGLPGAVGFRGGMERRDLGGEMDRSLRWTSGVRGRRALRGSSLDSLQDWWWLGSLFMGWEVQGGVWWSAERMTYPILDMMTLRFPGTSQSSAWEAVAHSGPVSPGWIIEAVGLGVGSVDGKGISGAWGARERPAIKG